AVAWSPARPTLTVDTDLSEFDEYEVRVYDSARHRSLVAAVEIVSPSNKDRHEHRQAFINKCAALLREDVSVVIVDLVTERHANLYSELLELIGQSDPSMGDEPPGIYAAALRRRRRSPRSKARVLDLWPHALRVGDSLPRLPLWLGEDLAVPLDLEDSYEETCETLDLV
ncbi:MAG: DUF4058 family protein, partial [Gemmataceae bacterium]|nr:DUF4058 family protein [Gemmataceae bacterium]